jgi:NTP pyrophosphatase (non-canonical NTP hydrolase)
MDFSEYQLKAKKTAIYPKKDKIVYPALGLVGEAGEIANKVKKVLRDDGGHVTENRRNDLASEIGDVLWYVAALSTDLKLNLDDIAKDNIEKLFSRQQRNSLKGEGDNR